MALKPSQVLLSLFSELSSSEFSKFLEKEVYPLLDSLPITKCPSFLKVLEEWMHNSIVEYRAKEDQLWKKIRALEKHIDNN
jgi:hypothetical protein